MPEWAVVVAEEQTLGHGRHGRIWVSPKGKNLCFNIMLPTKNLKPEFYAPVAQIAAITLAGIVGGIVKWPNDVLVNKRKICGIISELLPGSAYISLGIGLNVNAQEADFAGLDKPATSIFIETGRIFDKEILLMEFLEKFEINFKILRENGLQAFIGEWRKMGCFAGHKARVLEGGLALEGVIETINDDGSLLFRTENKLKTIWSGDLEI